MNTLPTRIPRYTKAGLTSTRRRLLEIMQRVGFGRIENLTIDHGEPCFNPPPKVIQEIKLGGAENGPRPELAHEDFILKSEVTELFTRLGHLGDISVAIEVKHGLPFRLIVEQQA